MVCVVADDMSFLRALKRLLMASGFAVEVFSSVENFLESDHGKAPDCLVLDVHLGGMSGLDLYDQLVASGTRIPVVFVTAHDDALTRERARRTGEAEYLAEPFDHESLLGAIHRALDRG